MKSWSPPRVAAGIALGSWAVLFWFLLVSGRSSLYVSSRTFWVIPLGAVILTIAAAGRLLTARTPSPEPLSGRDAWGAGLIILPVVAVLALPPASLGSFAADRRTVSAGGIVATSGADISSGQVTLVDVAGAQWSDEALAALVSRAGSRVSFVGFIARREGMPADEFQLTRFVISCCVADALTVQVRVVNAPPGELEDDQWVRVTGTMYPLGREVVVDASEVVPVDRPPDPYLNP